MGRVDGLGLRGSVEAAPRLRIADLGARVLSAVVLLPIFLWIVLAGPLWLYGVMITAVAALGQWEFTGMFERAGVHTFRVGGLVGGTILTASVVWSPAEGATFTLVLLGLLALTLARAARGHAAWQPLAVTLLGVGYVNWLLGYGVRLRALEGGSAWLLLLVWVTWLGETAAYVIGAGLGRRKLVPAISPGKTVEGAVAQVAVSILAAIAAAWFVPELRPGPAAIIGAGLGVVGQVGDLVESALKRSVGTKDTGHLIPGHGGILDRLDGLLFNTPVLFYYATCGRTWHP
jgi:phosphatidate cytidylyltransferase